MFGENRVQEACEKFSALKEKLENAFLTKLTGAERIALMLRMNGVPVKEIASHLGSTEKAAEKAIERARKKIKNSI